MTKKFIFSLLLLSIILTVCSSKNTIIDLQGHRGARGLYPENTWPAIKAGIDNGMDTVEVDFNLTADNNYVAHHDATVHDGNCRRKFTSAMFFSGKIFGDDENPPIKSLTLANIKKYDCGYGNKKKFPRLKRVKNTRMLTIQEVVKKIRRYEKQKKKKKSTLVNIEIKIQSYDINELVKASNILNDIYMNNGLHGKATIQSFNHEFLNQLKKINSSIPIIAIFGGAFRNSPKLILETADRIDAIGINVYHKIATQSFIEDAHDEDLRVLVWTINKPAKMKKFFNAGVDGVISDYPDLLYKTYKKWYKKVST